MNTTSDPDARRRLRLRGADALAMSLAKPCDSGGLVSLQAAILVTSDEDLEHRAAVLIDELLRAGALAEERPVDESGDPA